MLREVQRCHSNSMSCIYPVSVASTKPCSL